MVIATCLRLRLFLNTSEGAAYRVFLTRPGIVSPTALEMALYRLRSTNAGTADPGDPTALRVTSTAPAEFMFDTLKLLKLTLVVVIWEPVGGGALVTTGHKPSGMITSTDSGLSYPLNDALIVTFLDVAGTTGLGLPLTQFVGLEGLLALNVTTADADPIPETTVRSPLVDVIELKVNPPDLVIVRFTSYLSSSGMYEPRVAVKTFIIVIGDECI